MTFFEAYEEMKKGKVVYKKDPFVGSYCLRLKKKDSLSVIQRGSYGWQGLSWRDATMYVEYLDATDWEVLKDTAWEVVPYG